MSDETKTKAELLAEIEALKKQLAQAGTGGKTESTEDTEAVAVAAPVVAEPHTRRGALGWIAPVILSLGTAAKSGTAQAQADDDGSPAPTSRAPTSRAPTPRAPTSRAPTSRAPTSRAPTSRAPTAAGRCIPGPTAAPTVSPTLGMGSVPNAGPSSDAFVALGSARACARSFLAMPLPSRGDWLCALPRD